MKELIDELVVLCNRNHGVLPTGEAIAIFRRHYEGRPAVDEKPLELMTRDELLAYVRLPTTPLLNPDMPAQELRLYMGELTASEVRVARAVIRWA